MKFKIGDRLKLVKTWTIGGMHQTDYTGIYEVGEVGTIIGYSEVERMYEINMDKPVNAFDYTNRSNWSFQERKAYNFCIEEICVKKDFPIPDFEIE